MKQCIGFSRFGTNIWHFIIMKSIQNPSFSPPRRRLSEVSKNDGKSKLDWLRSFCFGSMLQSSDRQTDRKRDKLYLRWLTTVLMEYNSTTFNSFEKGSKLFSLHYLLFA